MEKPVKIRIDKVTLDGEMGLPKQMKGVVLFSHGTGSNRLDPRNTYIAKVLQKAGISTLLFGLLTNEEDQSYKQRYDIELLTRRLVGATHWLTARPELKDMTVAYFGVSTGAAAALEGGSFAPMASLLWLRDQFLFPGGYHTPHVRSTADRCDYQDNFPLPVTDLLLPVDARNRADVDGFILDHFFGCAGRIIAFRLAVIGKAEHIGNVVDAEAATDTHILIYPRFFSHFDFLP